MQFLPTLRARAAGAIRLEKKSGPAIAFANYYATLAGYNHTPTREWPIERAVAEGYDRGIWVYRCVNTIAADSARLPYRLYEGDEEDAPVVEDHPMYRVLNKKANPLETGQVFRKRLSAQVLLSKRGAFVEITKSNAGNVMRLDLLPPDRIEIIPGTGSDLIDHFRFNLRNGGVRNLDPKRVRWFRDPHPLDPYSGTTRLESMGMSIELDHFARLYNVAFMQNDGRPGGVLAVRKTDGQGGDIDPKQMDRIEDRFGKGPQEAGKLSVIAGDLSYVDLAARPRDMQYGETSRNSKNEILSGFGIGESVMGYAAERTFDNADNEFYVYWTRTMPEHNEILLTGFDEDSEDSLNGRFDTSGIEVLNRTKIARRAEGREEVAAGVRSLFSYAKLAGYETEIDETPHTRALYIASGKTPLPSREDDAEALGLGTVEEEPPGPPGLPPGGGGPPALPTPGGAPAAPGALAPGARTPAALPPGQPRPAPGAPPSPGAAPGAAAARAGAAAAALAALAGRKDLLGGGGAVPKARAVYRLTETKAAPAGVVESSPNLRVADAFEREIADALDAMVERWTERAVARLRSHQQRKGTRHWTPAGPDDTRMGTKALDTAKAVDEQTWQTEAEEATHPIITAAAIAAALALLTDLGVKPPPGMTLARMAAQAVALTVISAAQFVGASAARQARKIVADLTRMDQEEDADLDTIVQHVRDRADRLGRWAEGLAVQVATGTTNLARDDAAVEANRDEGHEIDRLWLSRRDTKVRDSHRTADGQVRRLGEPFVVGDSLLRCPGDPLAPLHETANCRCYLRHRSRRSGRWVREPAEKALMVMRDGDGDGFIEDGTPRMRPAPMRAVLPQEAAVAAGVERVNRYIAEAQGYDGDDYVEHIYAVDFTTAKGHRIVTGDLDVQQTGDWSFDVTGELRDFETDALVATFGRTIMADGDVKVVHDGLTVERGYQGEGIASEFNAHAIAWYKAVGIGEIQVLASGSLNQNPPQVEPNPDIPETLAVVLAAAASRATNGGYTWGQAGFDFAPNAFAGTIPGSLAHVAHAEPEFTDLLREWSSDGAEVVLDHASNTGLLRAVPHEWFDSAEHRSILADWLDGVDPDDPPSPYEINSLGSARPFIDIDTGLETWLGKALMSRSTWSGYFDLSWLDVYLETKDARSRKRVRLLGDAFLAFLADDDPGHVEAVRDGERKHLPGRHNQLDHGNSIRHTLGGALGRPFAETQARERARREAQADALLRAPRRHDRPETVRPAWDLERDRRRAAAVPMLLPGDPIDPTVIQAGVLAERLADRADRFEQAGGNPGILDRLVQLARAYQRAVEGGGPESLADYSRTRLLALVDEIRGLRLRDDELLGEDFAADLATLANLPESVPALTKSGYTVGVKERLGPDGEPRDADSDGLVYEGTARERPARPRVTKPKATTYRRAVGGWMHPTGAYFLERMSRMAGGNTNGWAIMERVDDPAHIGQDEGSTRVYDTRDGRPLTEYGEPGVYYAHVGDEPSLAEAKLAVENLLNPPDPHVLTDEEANRAAVYAAEAALPNPLLMRAVTDEWAEGFASEALGQPVQVYRSDQVVGGLEPGKHIFGVWATAKAPVIVAPPDYPLSQHEVYHETAHLLTERGRDYRDRRGHNEDFQRAYLSLADDATRDLLIQRGFPNPDAAQVPAAATGTADDPIHVNGDLSLAVRLIADGKHVRLDRVDEVGTLLEELAAYVAAAKASGADLPDLDLCQVSVPGTNLFCHDTLGIPRLEMPQLSGKPIPGTPSDALPRNERGNVNVKPAFLDTLRRTGVAVTPTEVHPSFLKATQGQLDAPSVTRIVARLHEGGEVGSGMLVTRDGYILDGHHQWAAQVSIDAEDNELDRPLTVQLIDMEIGEALPFAREFGTAAGIMPTGIGAANTASGPAERGTLNTELASLVAAVRGDTGQLGVCGVVTTEIESQYGYPKVTGFYNGKDGDGNDVWVPHAWNVMPGGDVLDATADQFGLPQVRTVPAAQAVESGYRPFTPEEHDLLDGYRAEHGREPGAEDWALLLLTDEDEHEPIPDGGVLIENLRPVPEHTNVWEGTIAADTPPLWRNIGNRVELEQAVDYDYEEWWAADGGFTVRGLEGDTQFAATREQALDWSHPMRNETPGYWLLVETDLSGLPVRFIGRPDETLLFGETQPPNMDERDDGTAVMFPTTTLGVGVLGKIPLARIQNIYSHRDGEIRRDFEGIEGYRAFRAQMLHRDPPAPLGSAETVEDFEPEPEVAPVPEVNPDFGKRVGAPFKALRENGYVLMERIGTRTPGQTINRVIYRVERDDNGVWGVYPPTSQSPPLFQTAYKRQAEKWAADRAAGIPDPDESA